MGLEYKIETDDEARTALSEFLRQQPEFLCEQEGAFHFGSKEAGILFTALRRNGYVYLCQHVASRETDALLGLIVRRLLSLNDPVVISEV